MANSESIRGAAKATGRSVPGPRVQRAVNTPLAVGTVVFLAIFVPGVWFWHAYQARKTIGALVERAEELESQGESYRAAENYLLYLKAHPDDVDARIRLAQTYDRAATSLAQKGTASGYYYDALSAVLADRGAGYGEFEQPLRRRLSELLLELRQFVSAEGEAEKLLNADANDPKGRRTFALALYGEYRSGLLEPRRLAEIAPALENAFKLNPGDVQLAEALAEVYRGRLVRGRLEFVPDLMCRKDQESLKNDERQARAELAKRADKCMDDLVADAPADAKAIAQLARSLYRSRWGLPDARKDLDEALANGPEDARVLLAVAADRARQAATQKRLGDKSADAFQKLCQEACAHYRHVIRINPAWERAYLGLGDILASQDKLDEAIEAWEAGVKACGWRSIHLNTRLAEVWLQQQKFDRAQKALEQVDDATARYRQFGTAPADIPFLGGADVLRARLLVQNRDEPGAIALLRRVADGPKGSDQEGYNAAYQAQMQLGSIHGMRGEPEKAAKAYAEAASLEPQLAVPHLAAGSVWMAIGRLDSAIDHFTRAVAVEPTPENYLLLATARYRDQLRQPTGERNWDEFHKAIAEAKKLKAKMPLADPWRIDLLEAQCVLARQYEAGRGEPAVQEALQRLRAAEEAAASSPAGLESAAAAYQALGARADADRALDKLEKVARNTPRAYTIRARILASRKEYEQARAVLQKGLAALPVDTRLPLELALAQLSLSQGREDEGWRRLLELQANHSSNAALVRELLEVSLDIGKYSDTESLEKILREIEGDDGLDWRFYRALRLVTRAAGPQDKALDAAEEQVTKIREQRPDWPAVHWLNGLILERRGKAEGAVNEYQEAIRLGEQRLAVYEHLIVLLEKLQRLPEKDRYLARLQDRSAASAGLSSMEISESLRMGSLDRALEKARRGTQVRPKDPLAQIWLGQVLALDNQPNEAEKAFRKAIELAPADPSTYDALANFYLRTNQWDLGRRTLEELRKSADVSPLQRAVVLGHGYETLGEWDMALACYREAERLDPKSALIQERLAAVLFRTNPGEAEQRLRHALELDPKSAMARRMLAGLLALRGGQKEWEEAIQWLDQGSHGVAPSEADRRLEALLLARRGGKKNLAQARLIADRLIADAKSPLPADRLLLAQLLEAEANITAAGREYAAVAGLAHPAPAHLAAYVEFLLRQNAPNDAAPWLDRLEKQLPDNPVAVGLRVRCLHAQKRTAEIGPFLEKAAERFLAQYTKAPQDSRRELESCVAIGDLYSSAELYEAAEKWYRRAAKIDPKRYERLALSVAQQGRVKDAVALCTEAAASDKSSRPAITLASVLVATRPTQEDVSQADALLNQALADHKDDAELLMSLANLRNLQDRPEEACELYRRVLAIQPKHVLALNNLATLLAEQQGQGPEAIRCADLAIELAGPQPELLDTKGTALFYTGKPADAAAALRDALSSPNPDPRLYLHLAAACDRLGDPGQAREALQRAERGQLTRQPLTGGDRKLLAELSKKLR